MQIVIRQPNLKINTHKIMQNCNRQTNIKTCTNAQSCRIVTGRPIKKKIHTHINNHAECEQADQHKRMSDIQIGQQ